MAAGRLFVFSVLLLNLVNVLSSPGQKSDWNRPSSYSASQFNNPASPKVNLAPKYQFLSTLKLVGHLVSTPRGRRYYGSRTYYYANSDSSFQQSRLLTSDDVSFNPGPNSNPPKCSVCSKTVARNHRALSCDQCEKWCHIGCGNVKLSDYKKLQRLTTFEWCCPRCLQPTEIIANSLRNEYISTAAAATTSNNIKSTESQEDPFLVFKQSVGDKNLKIGHLNINGLVNKLSEVQYLLDVAKFDLLGITETHLNPSISDDWIRISGYNIVRKDRDSRGGGVLIYFKEDLTVHPAPSWERSNLEATWLNITIRSQSFLVGCVYRPPNDSFFFEPFRDLIANIWVKRKNIILVGDLNSDMLHKLNNSESEYGKRLRRILRSCGLKNIINSPTRITAHSKSLIDLVITSQPSKIQTSGSIDLGISDHHLIFAVFKVARSNAKPKVISTRNYKSLDKRQLRSDFDQAPWHITELFDDIDDSLDTWQYLLVYNEILHHHLPPRDVKIRDKSLPWINTSIRKEMNKRYKLLNKAKSSGDPEIWSLYKQK